MNWAFGGAVTVTAGYYLALGRYLGMSPSQCVTTCLKRLARRRGILWHLLLAISFSGASSALNYYYRCYIMPPKYRVLHSIPDDNRQLKTRLISAYGGRGLALQRLYSAENVTDGNFVENAENVALHYECCEIKQEIDLVFSHVFYGGVGFKFRNKHNTDGIPEECFFNSVDNLNNCIQLSNKVDSKYERKRTKEATRRARLTPEQRDKENKAQAKKLLDQLNAEDEKEDCHFGIGKAYGGNKWEERLVKATSSSLTKSMSERLEVLQMLAKIQTANDRATFSTHTLASYFGCFLLYESTWPLMTSVRHLVTKNEERHCLCSYYPYYVGLFPGKK